MINMNTQATQAFWMPDPSSHNPRQQKALQIVATPVVCSVNKYPWHKKSQAWTAKTYNHNMTIQAHIPQNYGVKWLYWNKITIWKWMHSFLWEIVTQKYCLLCAFWRQKGNTMGLFPFIEKAMNRRITRTQCTTNDGIFYCSGGGSFGYIGACIGFSLLFWQKNSGCLLAHQHVPWEYFPLVLLHDLWHDLLCGIKWQ